MRHRLLTITAAAVLVVVAVALTGFVTQLAEQTTTHWGDLYTTGFGLALLIAWPAGTLIFTNRSRRHRT